MSFPRFYGLPALLLLLLHPHRNSLEKLNCCCCYWMVRGRKVLMLQRRSGESLKVSVTVSWFGLMQDKDIKILIQKWGWMLGWKYLQIQRSSIGIQIMWSYSHNRLNNTVHHAQSFKSVFLQEPDIFLTRLLCIVLLIQPGEFHVHTNLKMFNCQPSRTVCN